MSNKTVLFLIFVLGIFLISGCSNDEANSRFKDVPEKCKAFSDDVCGLFSCMTDNCWCDEGIDGAVLMEGTNDVENEDGALFTVLPYLGRDLLTGNERAVKLNSVFYNVFIDYADREEVFTVANDGTIIKTVCGV